MIVSTTDCDNKFKTLMWAKGILFKDNNGAWTVASNQRVTSRTKYFQVKWHHFWQYVKDGTLIVNRVDTKDQLADYFTKGLSHELFVKNRKSTQGW